MTIYKLRKVRTKEVESLFNSTSVGKQRSQDVSAEFHPRIYTLNDSIKGRLCLCLGVTYTYSLCVNKYI